MGWDRDGRCDPNGMFTLVLSINRHPSTPGPVDSPSQEEQESKMKVGSNESGLSRLETAEVRSTKDCQSYCLNDVGDEDEKDRHTVTFSQVDSEKRVNICLLIIKDGRTQPLIYSMTYIS